MDAKITVTDFINIDQKLGELGLSKPGGITILPQNITHASSKEELIYSTNTLTVRSLLRQNGVKETPIETDDNETFELIEKDFIEWVGPMILISYSLISQDPTIISITLNVISNYITDFFKGKTEQSTATLSFTIQTKDNSYKNLSYQGPPEKVQEILETIKEIAKHE